MPMIELQLRTPGELLDEIARLRAALQKIADLPAPDTAAPFRKASRRIAIDALKSQAPPLPNGDR